jgi:membrane protein CcdC involved in cytochrome C biogenesis
MALIQLENQRLWDAFAQAFRWCIAGFVAGIVNIAADIGVNNLFSLSAVVVILVSGLLIATGFEYWISEEIEPERES